MKCTPCEGSGLKSDYEVCPDCKGVGHDGLDMEVVEAKPVDKSKRKKK